MTNIKSIENISFEEALRELEEIVRKIDSGNQALEDSVNYFERGVLLKKHCENKLKEAKLKIEKITKSQEGLIKIEEIELSQE